MRAVVQRVRGAAVSVAGETVGRIGDDAAGLTIFLGVGREDGTSDADWMAERVLKLRIFDDGDGRMNRSIVDTGGGILVISQFTLFGSTRKGNRPSFNRAAPPDLAMTLYGYFVELLASRLAAPVATGRFGAEMRIEACQDGPVTLILDSKERDF